MARAMKGLSMCFRSLHELGKVLPSNCESGQMGRHGLVRIRFAEKGV